MFTERYCETSLSSLHIMQVWWYTRRHNLHVPEFELSECMKASVLCYSKCSVICLHVALRQYVSMIMDVIEIIF
jgi:hypothetical protein